MTEIKGRYKIRTKPIPIVEAEYSEPFIDSYTGLIIRAPGQAPHKISTGSFWDDMVAARAHIKGLGFSSYLINSTVSNLIEDMPDEQQL